MQGNHNTVHNHTKGARQAQIKKGMDDQQVFAWEEERSTVRVVGKGSHLSTPESLVRIFSKPRRFDRPLHVAACTQLPQNNTSIKHHHRGTLCTWFSSFYHFYIYVLFCVVCSSSHT